MSPRNEDSSDFALYTSLLKSARERTWRPIRHPSFVAFFVLAVFGLGAAGVWLEVYVLLFPEPHSPCTPSALHHLPSSTEALRTALITFFTAVAGTSAMQLVWAEELKHFRSASALVLFLFLVAALVIFPSRISDSVAITAGVIMSLVSLWVWWVANAMQLDLLDRIDPSDPVGGRDPHAPLGGDRTGWNTGP